ncbi:hypothetical protein OC842_004680 [Tilletia horrida]|uniref:Uncharacterized protein n=1 Tax=Tilletia horrida TaxID=155126 RepID=A0AAN6JJN0_9BASI|nr:hypothetical protein OC842_004680 [Tilletia horrida]
MPTLSDLPGEVLVRVVNQHLASLSDEDNPREWLRQIQTIASINTRFRAATQHVLSRHFQMLSPAASAPLPNDRAASAAWLPYIRPEPGTVTAYWRGRLGPDFDQVPSLAFQAAWIQRCLPNTIKMLSLDLRVARFDTIGEARTWNALQAPQWINSSAILARIAGTTSELEAMHVRISSQEEQLAFLQDIVRSNPLIKSLVIEVDSALDIVPAVRPVIQLDRYFCSERKFIPLERFVLRAPACEVVSTPNSPFLKRLAEATEVRIAAYRLEVSGQPWQWCTELLRACPLAKQVELAASRGNSYGQEPPTLFPSVMMPDLLDLTLDMPEVDGRLLRRIKAPSLARLRINTRARIDEWGKVDMWHFPALSWVRVRCYSPVAARLEVLGLPRSSFSRSLVNLASVADEWIEFDGDFVADIRTDRTATQAQPFDHPTSPSSTSSSGGSSLWLQSPHASTSLVLISPSHASPASPTPLALQGASEDGAAEFPGSSPMSAFATPTLHLSPAPETISEAEPEAHAFAASTGIVPSTSWTPTTLEASNEAGPSAQAGPSLSASSGSHTEPPSLPSTSPASKRRRL